MDEKKQPKSLSKFKDEIFEQEHILSVVIPSLSFMEVMKLMIQVKPQLLRSPLDLHSDSGLAIAWELILQHHALEFLYSNAFYHCHIQYRWSQPVIDIVYKTLKQRLEQIHMIPSALPWFYLPNRVETDDLEALYLYSRIPIYSHFYVFDLIEMYGPYLQESGLLSKKLQIAKNQEAADRGGINERADSKEEWNFIVSTNDGTGATSTTTTDRQEIARMLFDFMKSFRQWKSTMLVHLSLFRRGEDGFLVHLDRGDLQPMIASLKADKRLSSINIYLDTKHDQIVMKK